ncbi:MAG: hypothetical protein QHH07_12250, partial [Sedimentisphaerales bacterium]|nr:hypothetical protein [Sedimentisphaerales bacterium]
SISPVAIAGYLLVLIIQSILSARMFQVHDNHILGPSVGLASNLAYWVSLPGAMDCGLFF